MIGFSQLEDLAQLQSRFAEHADAGRRIEWLGAGAQALRLSDCAADNAARAAIAPAIELQQRATSTSGTVAAISLIFSPPFDLAEHPEGKRRDDLRAAHLSAARMALQHIEEWSAVFDEHGKRDLGLVGRRESDEQRVVAQLLPDLAALVLAAFEAEHCHDGE